MLRFTALLCLFVAASLADEELNISKRKYKPDPLEEGGTDEAVFGGIPIVLNARKMSKLMPDNNVVMTCRYMLFKAYKDFREANKACQALQPPFTSEKTQMATVQNEAENEDIQSLLKLAFGVRNNKKPYNRENWVWIGLSKRVNNWRKLESKEKGVFNQSEWYFTNNEKIRWGGKWHVEMPDQQYNRKLKEYQNWVVVNKRGYWDDTYASTEAPYACQYCGKYIVLSGPAKWEQAKEKCKAFNLTMAIVDSHEDNEELAWAAELALGKDPEEKRWDHKNWVWIGTQETVNAETGEGTGEWKHHDGSEMSWKPNWDRKMQPDNWRTQLRGDQNYVAFSRINKKWDDSFNHNKRPFACMCPTQACHHKNPTKN